MHLFIVHQFPDIDNFLPIISRLKKQTNQKYILMNVYPIHDLNLYCFNNILDRYDVECIDLFKISFRAKLINLLFKLVPVRFLLRFKYIWHYFYHKYFFFNEKNIHDLIKTKRIKSINIDHSLPDRYKSIFFKLKKKTDIKLITYKLGVEMRNDINIRKVTYENSDYAVVEDCSTQFKVSDEDKKKIFRISNPRYSLSWLDEIDKEYNYKFNESDYLKKKRNLRVLLITRPFFSYKSWKEIFNNLKKINSIDVKIKFKPRGDFVPLKYQNDVINGMNTSELINWSDVIISHATSVLLEAIIKNKKILFLKYLLHHENKEKINYVFENQNFIEEINSFSQIEEKINSYKELPFPQKFELNTYDDAKSNFIKKLIGDGFDKNNIFEKNFLKLYEN